MANAGFNDETTINANLTGNSTLNASLGSVNQTNVNLPPINYIPGYKVAEEERRENEEERISNENAREEYINELKEEVASGAFDGKDGQDGRDGAIQYTAGTGIEITDENVINNTLTSAEWGNITGTLSNQSDLSTALSGKANTSDIPTKVSDLTNDSGFIDNTVDNLTNYYTKSQTYTSNEIDSLIAQIPGFNVVVVQTLPVSDIDPHTIYLVPKTGSSSDIYDEYIYINNVWELIGNTQADLTNYYTKSETDTLLGNKQNTLVSGTNIKTINEESILGSGNVSVPKMMDEYGSSLSNGYSQDYINDIADTIPTMDTTKGTSTTNGYAQSYINTAISGTTLYNNSTGSNGTITLSSSAANYDYLEIYYKDNDNYVGSVKIYSPNGKSVLLTSGAFVPNELYFKGRVVSISGTSISTTPTNRYGQFYYSGGSTGFNNNNYIYITMVVGYK